MATFICLFAFLIAWICIAVWLCGVMMKPVKASFESGFSISDSANRLSMVCMPFNPSGNAFQWIFGTATASKVTLECRTKGVKRSFGQFNGKFILEGNRAVLAGEFGMAPGAKMSLILWLTVLVPGLLWVTRKLAVDFTQGTFGLFIFICCMLGFIVWVTKIRFSEFPGEVKFLSANIKNLLLAAGNSSTSQSSQVGIEGSIK